MTAKRVRTEGTAAGEIRRRRVVSVQAGNVNAMTHGVRAEVQNARDVQVEIGLTFATHPGLDPLADRRLVELLSTTRIQRQRAVLAMATGGLTAILTSYDARLAPLEERLERTVYERERQRLADRAKGDPLDRWRSGAAS